MVYMVAMETAAEANDSRPARSAVYRNVAAIHGWPMLRNDIQTLYESFQISCRANGDRMCLGMRNTETCGYDWLTYDQVRHCVDLIGSGLAKSNVGRGESVGIYGANCPYWSIAMHACNRQAAVCVPLYDSLGAGALRHIIADAAVRIVLLAEDKLQRLADALLGNGTTVHTVVYWPAPRVLPGKDKEKAIRDIQATGARAITWDEFGQLGEATAVSEPTPPCPDDICTIMYTSGTTGLPKGAVLAHRAVVAQMAAQLAYFEQCDQGLTADDAYLSFLPLAHIFGRVVEEILLHSGARIGYWQGIPDKLLEDVAALQPTIFCGVPRVFDRIYTQAMANIAALPSWKQYLFRWAFASKLAALERGYCFTGAAPLWDRLVFKKGKALLGGNVRVIVSGGAPMARKVEEFLEVFLCCPIVQGYGLTESCAGSFVAMPTDWSHTGTVGAATPGVDICLESVPGMGYDAHGFPARGEILLRGPTLFSGYHGNAEATRERVDADGWLHTGDIGEFQPHLGSLRIIDRKSNIIKLSQGEYVSLEKVEGIYGHCALIEQIWVYGTPYESSLVAVCVPRPAGLLAWARENEAVDLNVAHVCQVPAASQLILDALAEIGRNEKLPGYEIVKAIHLEPEPFTVDNDLLTPTLKLKRPQLLKRYGDVIDQMYVELNHYGSVDF